MTAEEGRAAKQLDLILLRAREPWTPGWDPEMRAAERQRVGTQHSAPTEMVWVSWC